MYSIFYDGGFMFYCKECKFYNKEYMFLHEDYTISLYKAEKTHELKCF